LTCNPGGLRAVSCHTSAGQDTTLPLPRDTLLTRRRPSRPRRPIAGHDLVKDRKSVRRSIGFPSVGDTACTPLRAGDACGSFASLPHDGAPLMRLNEVLDLADITPNATEPRPAFRLCHEAARRPSARARVDAPCSYLRTRPRRGWTRSLSRQRSHRRSPPPRPLAASACSSPPSLPRRMAELHSTPLQSRGDQRAGERGGPFAERTIARSSIGPECPKPRSQPSFFFLQNKYRSSAPSRSHSEPSARSARRLNRPPVQPDRPGGSRDPARQSRSAWSFAMRPSARCCATGGAAARIMFGRLAAGCATRCGDRHHQRCLPDPRVRSTQRRSRPAWWW